MPFGFLLLGVYLLYNRLIVLKQAEVRTYLLFIGSLLIYSLSISLIKQSGDYWMPYQMLLFIVDYLVGGVLIVFLLRHYGCDNLKDTLKILVWVIAIHAVIMIAMVLNPSIKNLVFSILREDGRSEWNEYFFGLRGTGIAATYAYDLAVVQSFGLIFISYLIFSLKTFARILLYVLLYLIILISVLISGRTGWIGIGLSLMILGLKAFHISGYKVYLRKQIIKFSLIVFSLFVFVGFVFLSFGSAKFQKTIEDELIPWAFEFFINYGEKGKVETESSNELKDMYFEIPYDAWSFGHGYFMDPYDTDSYYMSTDAGYMRFMLYFGLPGSILLYGFWLWFFLRLYYRTKQSSEPFFASLILVLGLYFFTVQIKGAFMVESNVSIRFVLLLFLVIINLPKVTNKNKSLDNRITTEPQQTS